MIAYIKGELMDYGSGSVTLTAGGIGYEIFCSAAAYARILNEKGGGVYTYLAVRDDGVSLYGFDTLGEKSMFLKLIGVSGVGPKLAMTVLSGMNLRDLAFCIASSDVKMLSSIKGLGKKTAERIILELREAISADGLPETAAKKPTAQLGGDSENAVLALMTLGYTRAVAENAVAGALESGASGLEDIIATALRKM